MTDTEAPRTDLDYAILRDTPHRARLVRLMDRIAPFGMLRRELIDTVFDIEAAARAEAAIPDSRLRAALERIGDAYGNIPAGEPRWEQVDAALPALYDAIGEGLRLVNHPFASTGADPTDGEPPEFEVVDDHLAALSPEGRQEPASPATPTIDLPDDAPDHDRRWQRAALRLRAKHHALFDKVVVLRDAIPSTETTALAVIGEVLSIIEKEDPMESAAIVGVEEDGYHEHTGDPCRTCEAIETRGRTDMLGIDFRGTVYEGISYPISLRATPWRDADGMPTNHTDEVMWSADLAIEEGIGLTASGATPADALAALQVVICNHTRYMPPEEQP